jgi:hypothetical protein
LLSSASRQHGETRGGEGDKGEGDVNGDRGLNSDEGGEGDNVGAVPFWMPEQPLPPPPLSLLLLLTWRNPSGWPAQPGLTWRNPSGWPAQPGLMCLSVCDSICKGQERDVE